MSTAGLVVLLCAAVLGVLVVLASDWARKLGYLGSIGVSPVTGKKRRDLQAHGQPATGVIDDLRVMYPLRRSGDRRTSVDLTALLGGSRELEDTEAQPTAIYLLYEFEIEHQGRPSSFRGAQLFDGEAHEAVRRVGEKVKVRYLPRDPSISAIET